MSKDDKDKKTESPFDPEIFTIRSMPDLEKLVKAHVETELYKQMDGYRQQAEDGVRAQLQSKFGPHSKVKLVSKHQAKCPLCSIYDEQRRIVSRFHGETNKFIVVHCITCQIPMWVGKKHEAEPKQKDIDDARAYCKERFGDSVTFRGPRNIFEHFHEHVIE